MHAEIEILARITVGTCNTVQLCTRIMVLLRGSLADTGVAAAVIWLAPSGSASIRLLKRFQKNKTKSHLSFARGWSGEELEDPRIGLLRR